MKRIRTKAQKQTSWPGNELRILMGLRSIEMVARLGNQFKTQHGSFPASVHIAARKAVALIEDTFPEGE